MCNVSALLNILPVLGVRTDCTAYVNSIILTILSLSEIGRLEEEQKGLSETVSAEKGSLDQIRAGNARNNLHHIMHHKLHV